MNKPNRDILIIVVILLVLGWTLWCSPVFALTAKATWDIGGEPDLYGYTFTYKVDNGPWIPHRDGTVIPLSQMTQKDGRTGRWFKAPDNGKTFRLRVHAVDDSGNESDPGPVIVIDTFYQQVYVEGGPLFEDFDLGGL